MFRFPAESLRRTIALIACLALLQTGRSADDKKLSIYVPGATFSHRVHDVNGQEYVSLLDIVQPIASVNVKSDKGAVRVKVNSADFEFREGSDKVRSGRKDLDLGGKAVVEPGRILVPIGSLVTLLPPALKVRIEMHRSSRRLFLDNAVSRFSAELKTESSTLALTFSQPVAPSISTEGGKMRIAFSKEPVLPTADSYTYSDKLFQNVQFVEANGAAEILVNGSAPLLASFTDGGKTILISAAPSAPVAQAPPTPAPGMAPAGETPSATTTTQAATTGPAQAASGTVRFFVMIDPAHGGAEMGARFSEKLTEKDVTLAIARRLKAELQNRGVNAVLLRDQDEELTVEQRALAANSQRAGLYVSIHAGAPGGNVRVFTALMPSTPPAKGIFIPWEGAQSSALERSRILAVETVSQLSAQKVAAFNGTAPVAPLNNITAPAIAIEVGPQKINSPVESLTQQSYQQSIAVATATAIVSARAKMEAAR